MQKVITIYSSVAFDNSSSGIQTEKTTYPDLEELFADGFLIKEIISKNSTECATSVTLLLEK